MLFFGGNCPREVLYGENAQCHADGGRDEGREAIGRRKNTSWTVRSRCKVLLCLAGGLTYSQCERKCGVSRPTVARVKRLMAEGGVEAVVRLNRNPNSNNGRSEADVKAEAPVLKFACETPPAGYSH